MIFRLKKHLHRRLIACNFFNSDVVTLLSIKEV